MKVPLAQLGEIPKGGIKEIDFFERSVLLTKVDNRYNAFVNVCTHADGPFDGRGRQTALPVAPGVLQFAERQEA
jgi:nitrite reductase/ring-hydroxylating ferredoxin subunit